jgi:hypothetical protein
LNVVNQIGSYGFGLAIVTIINHAGWQPGIYFSNEGEISWYQFALLFRKLVVLIVNEGIPTGIINTSSTSGVFYWIKVKLKLVLEYLSDFEDVWEFLSVF